jgi:hypothetical protein
MIVDRARIFIVTRGLHGSGARLAASVGLVTGVDTAGVRVVGHAFDPLAAAGPIERAGVAGGAGVAVVAILIKGDRVRALRSVVSGSNAAAHGA